MACVQRDLVHGHAQIGRRAHQQLHDPGTLGHTQVLDSGRFG